MSKMTLGRKITAGFALAALLLAALSTVSYINIVNLMEASRWINHTNLVLHRLDSILSYIKDAETGQRGYLITGEDRYLEPYKAAQAAIRKDVDEVRRLTSDNLKQQQRLSALDPLIASKLDELKETIDLRKSKGFDAALQVVLTDKGKKVMDDIRRVVGEMQEEENGLREKRSQDDEASSSRAKQTMTFGTLLSLVLLAGSGFLIVRSITRPINEIISGLAEGAQQVASASNQISSVSQELADGSSQQAAAIEETSSSLEEMASMTKQNAVNAGQANKLMTDARSVVDQANHSMTALNISMMEISRASEETQKIIKTIDEIAFQTNLLALNAAVEAARAGEAGAGFAVVADEVRNLAMRAADAAKSTADLIEGTVKKVREGSSMVEKTNEAFKQVAGTVAKSGELIEEIAAASQEQAQGIEQVNKAVSDMDKVTQQNSASAEESASASEQMSAQAEQMRDFVSELVNLVGGDERGRNGRRPQAREHHHAQVKVVHAAGKRSPLGALPKDSNGSGRERKRLTGAKEIDPRKVLPLSDNDMEFF